MLLRAAGDAGPVIVLAPTTGDERADAEVLATMRSLAPAVPPPPPVAPGGSRGS